MGSESFREGRPPARDWVPRVLTHPVHGILIERPQKIVGESARYVKADGWDQYRIVWDLEDAELLVPESLVTKANDRAKQFEQRALAAERRQRTFNPSELMTIVSSLSILLALISATLLGWRGFWVADLLGVAAVLGTYSMVSREKKEGPDDRIRSK